MKKSIALLVGALACSAAFAGMDNLRILFSTPGPDAYADGAVVQEGERYALVWKASEADTVTIAADGTVTGGKILLVHETAEDGRCTPVLFQADDGWMTENGYNTGVWAVYMLDTRLAKGGFSPLGADGLPTIVNASGVAKDSLSVSGYEPPAGAVESGVASALPAGVTAPVIKAIEVKGAFVHVTVENTFPMLQYTLEAGAAPGALELDKKASAQNGNESGTITIVTPKDGEAGFFKVIRK